jgi:glycosyltransferase involved in cell wall biosynthesis/SAM-dependent methyltransferase
MSSASITLARRVGVNVAGFLRGGLGLGQAARLYVAALQDAGIPVRTTTVDPRMPDVEGAELKTIDFTDLSTDEELPFNLVCVNAPELPAFAADVGPAFFEDRYTIGVWAWETDAVPATWDQSFRLVDEIWVYSSYVADILSRVAPCPVVRVPLPIVPPEPQGATVPFRLADGFTFLFMFDFYSTLQRKNPLGLVEAFKRAFAPGEGPQLLLKSFNGDYKPERVRRLRDAAGGRPDIHLVDRFVAERERAALMAACDCYVSLHRSEGFGLTLGEAMALGKPVIATDYSANLDFMTPANSYLVDYELTEVGPDGENYPAEGRWAEPDLDHAAALLREVYENQADSRARARRGRTDIAEAFSVHAVGEVARKRLRRISALGRRGTAADAAAGVSSNGALPDSWLALAESRIADPPAERAARAGGPKALARRALLTGLRPYSYHQDRMNEAIVAAVREMRRDFDELLADFQALAGHTHEAIRAGVLDAPGRRDLARVIEGMRTRPASTHPALTRLDERGRFALGFTGAAAGSGEGYRGFEDIFRGDEAQLRTSQQRYVEVFEGREWILDLGCGRGEFLEDLRDAGIRARGVDVDPTMVARCREKGLEVDEADAATALRRLEDRTLPAAFAAQVVEHLGHDRLVELLGLLVAKLGPRGVVVLETVNPHSPAALKAFWTDTTHHHPLFPEVLLAHCRLAGFDSGDVIFPSATGDFDRDVYENRDYAVIARTAG